MSRVILEKSGGFAHLLRPSAPPSSDNSKLAVNRNELQQLAEKYRKKGFTILRFCYIVVAWFFGTTYQNK